MTKLTYWLKRPIEKFSYYTGRAFFQRRLKNYFDFRIIGEENLPKESAIVVPNHQTGIYGLILSTCLSRHIHFLIQNEGVYDSKLKFCLWAIGEIPVNIDKRSTNKIVLKRAEDYLQHCRDFIGIFSEGPSKELVDENGEIIPVFRREHYLGAAHLAIKNMRSIIPIGIRLAEDFINDLWTFPISAENKKRKFLESTVADYGKIPYVINIGMPVFTNCKDDRNKLTEKVRLEICRLYEEAEKYLK